MSADKPAEALASARGAPQAPIRLVGLDLDQTLIGRDLTLSPRVKGAVASALARDVVVTIVTGRGPSPTSGASTQPSSPSSCALPRRMAGTCNSRRPR
jgi:hypothetical protein